MDAGHDGGDASVTDASIGNLPVGHRTIRSLARGAAQQPAGLARWGCGTRNFSVGSTEREGLAGFVELPFLDGVGRSDWVGVAVRTVRLGVGGISLARSEVSDPVQEDGLAAAFPRGTDTVGTRGAVKDYARFIGDDESAIGEDLEDLEAQGDVCHGWARGCGKSCGFGLARC